MGKRKLFRLTVVLIIPFLLTCCSKNETKLKDTLNEGALTCRTLAEPRQRESGNTKIKPVLKPVINRFADRTALEVFSESSGNQLYSPISLYHVLGMTMEGTEGKSREGILKLLGSEPNEIRNMMKTLIKDGTIDDDETKVLINNSIWIDERLANYISPEYLGIISEDYLAYMYSGNLLDQKTFDQMDKWVSDTTNGFLKTNIKKELDNSEGDINLVLLNTFYYKSLWKDEFDARKNIVEQFYNADGSQTKVEYMVNRFRKYEYVSTEDFQAVELQQSGGSMHFILPKKGSDPKNLLKSQDFLQTYLSTERTLGEVMILLPKFEYSCEYLKILDTLGLNEILGTEGVTNLSGLFKDGADRNLIVSTIFQKCRIIVDESGTESAAVTASENSEEAISEEQTLYLNLNRPFIFLITLETGEVVFVGIVNDMSSTVN